jgi:hypothetical protein
MRSIVSGVCVASVLACACMFSAVAEWKPEYAQAPVQVQDWYRKAELTAEASKRLNGWKSCCAHSDVVKAQFRVNKTDARDEWWWLNGEKWQRIPDDVIHWGQAAPGGRPTLFVYNSVETCFWPPDGGI